MDPLADVKEEADRVLDLAASAGAICEACHAM